MTQHVVEEADEPLKVKPPRQRQPVAEVILKPELSYEEAEDRWLKKHFDRTFPYKYRPQTNTFFRTEDGAAKLLFLRDVIDPDVCQKAYAHLRHPGIYTPATNSKRAALKGSPGGDCLFGYSDLLKPDHTGRRQTHPEWTARSVKFFPQFRGLWPICWEMEELLGLYLPHYWEGRRIDEPQGPALRDEDERNEFYLHHDKYKKQVQHWSDDWARFWYQIPGSDFTTITCNWNTVFRAHKDAHNSSGALSCLAAFGNFLHGELVFPRLGVAINAKERDLLVCDCPQELHATIPPLGTRYSMVVYTREGLTTAGLKRPG